MSAKKSKFKFKSQSPYDCEVCGKHFSSTMGLYSHQRTQKHGKHANVEYSKIKPKKRLKSSIDLEIRKHKQEVYTSMSQEQTKRKSNEELREALREQLAVDERPYYNIEAYQLAIRTMTTGEAYKLAKNELKSNALIDSYKHNLDVAVVENDEAIALSKGTGVIANNPSSSIIIHNKRGKKVEISTIGRDTSEQAAFRRAISINYNHRCCITGDSIAIEAAHIQTHSDYYDNSIDNGIMLSVGLHRLFDKGIMVIDPDSMAIHFTDDCFYKRYLEGAVITQGKIKINKEKLLAKNRLIFND
ncbi:TPA: HNH endonuclease [Providencia alcalifaciens]|uniref:HNH endonuclease signature motif containing protein n=1 Tax=Providencia rettgeri TaxID=587 RepID=UPI00204A67FA|nr:HNH endonuclease signature motif containing protein [Providencia rettgeri]UPS64865.1 HNH endonuclease [Providencia rettgeri]HEF8786763.1 HNH endonuclease [Providencia alcalifaciens]